MGFGAFGYILSAVCCGAIVSLIMGSAGFLWFWGKRQDQPVGRVRSMSSDDGSE